jgi:hypothetical protein
LLTPAATARLWRYVGTDLPDAGGVLHILLGISGIGVLAGTLSYLRPSPFALLAGIVLIGTPFYIGHTISQSADIPLSLYFLTTLAFLCFYWNTAPAEPRFLALAGFAAGCAAWTKNEGLLFALTTSVVLVAMLVWQRTRALPLGMYFLGLLGPLASTLFFNIWIAPPPQLTSNRGFEKLFAKATDWSR